MWTFLCFHFQDPKITVRVATDYFQVLWLMIKKVIIIIFYLYYTSFRWVNNFMQKEPLPILTTNIDAPGEGGAARARAPCLHRAHRCLLCQPGRSDSKQCSKMFPRAYPSLSTGAYFGRKSTWNHRHKKRHQHVSTDHNHHYCHTHGHYIKEQDQGF